MAHRVLVPYDGSEQSENALAYALDDFPESEVTVFHVVSPLAGHAGTGGYTETGYRQAVAAAEALVGAAAESAPDGREPHTEVTVGRPVKRILAYVEDGSFDHVVMGSRGRDGPRRLLLGSVAETVVRRSPVSVTVTR